MKTLIIAESGPKAEILGSMLQTTFSQNFKKQGDYLESQDYLLGHFQGHILEMVYPEKYDEKYKKWSIENLPIFPSEFKFDYKTGFSKLGKLLKDLSKNCDTIINATDPDREGEGIFRNWYTFEEINKPVKRLWATSLAMTDLIKAWENIKSSNQYDNIAYAQEARSQADWLVGINGSRLYTELISELCPVGRVKTAVLAMIVKRDYEVENYKESFTYSLTGLWGGYNFTYFERTDTKFQDKNSIELVLNKIVNDSFSLQSKNKEEKSQNPPKTFNLPDLQKEADKRFGFSLDKTLKVTQSLYMKKLVTYPRTDSPYLPESDLIEYYILINQIATNDQKKLLLPGTKPACVKNTDASHTAIIPTSEVPGGLTEDESKLYELIKERFIVAFMQPKIYDEYTLIISNGSETFRCILKSIKDFGFQNIYKEQEEDETNPEEKEVENIDEAKLSYLKSKINGLKVNAIKKTKPKYYTPYSLVTAMENAGNLLSDKKAREIMSEAKGLGTAATRQHYPVDLAKDGYIELKGRYLISTTKGKKIINIITPELKSIEKTAELEEKLSLIEKGKYAAAEYSAEIQSYVRNIIAHATNQKRAIEEAFNTSLPCPKCGGKLSRLKCNQCNFQLYTKVAGKIIEQKYVEQLLRDKKTDFIIGFQGPKGKFDARLKFDEEFNVKFDYEKDILGSCKCGGIITESLKAFNCDKCKSTVWKETYGKKLTEKQAMSLLQGKKIKVTGLKYKDNPPYDANLILINGKVQSEKL